MKPDKQKLEQFLDAGNLVDILDEALVSNIGSDVIDEYEGDRTDAGYQEKCRAWKDGQELAQLKTVEKNFPFKNAANIKYPLLTTAAIQFNARAYPGIVQGNSVVRPKIVGAPSKLPSEQEMQAQIQNLSPEERQMAAQMYQQMASEKGSKIRRAENVCEFINWQLFNELDEWEEDTDKLLLMLPLYGTMFRCVYYSMEKRRICTELLTPEQLVVPMGTRHMKDAPRASKCFKLTPQKITERIRSGFYADVEIQYDDEDKEEPESFVEQCKWLDLDEDGFKEPYIITVHEESGKVVRIFPNYRREDIHVNDAGEISKIDPLQYYVKYTFIPSTDGKFYDLGFFDLLLPINEVVNATTNMLLDAGTLENAGGGFISKDLKLRKKGPTKFDVGEYKQVDSSGEDIRKAIFTMPFKGPSPVLFQLLGFMLDAGRDVANLKEVLEGKTDNNMTATTTLALIEQGQMVFSGIYKRIHRSLSDELQLIRFWNHEIRNPLYGEVMDERLSQDDFSNDDLDFVPVSDPAVVTDMQKMGRVQFIMQFLNDPYFDQMKLRERIFEGANIDGFDDLRAGQDPQMAQMQQQMQQLAQVVQQLQEALQDQTFERKRELLNDETDAALKAAQAVKYETGAIKDIADAEAAEPGQQIDTYKAQADSLSDKGRVGSVGGDTRDKGVQGSDGTPRGEPAGSEAEPRPRGADPGRVSQALPGAEVEG